MKRILLSLTLLCLLVTTRYAVAQTAETTKLVVDYVNQYRDIAVFEMLRTRIPASITLAQGILESKSGTSRLALEGHNHFGIKCKSTWTGKVILEDDDDFQECFRSYDDAYLSYQDHSNFLLSSNRYAYLFDLDVTDYRSWAYGLKEAGYATSPTYAKQLIELIEKYNLKQYDRYTKNPAGMKDTTAKHEVVSTNGISSTKAKEYDSYTKIATENKMKVNDLLVINDLSEIKELHYGDVVYLKSKHTENNNYETHTVQIGESMRDISQRYGIKLSLLLERNGLKPGEEPSKGEVLTLNKKNNREVKKRKVVSNGTKTVDMRIHMGERSQTDSIIEAKYNTEATYEKKIDSVVSAIPPTPAPDSDYVGNVKKTDNKEDDHLDEVINNELYHYVRKGETLYGIAKAYDITVDELKAWNKLKDNSLHIFQKLQVTNHQQTGIKDVKIYKSDSRGYYRIQEGDSLNEIALHFGFSTEELADLNKINITDTLVVGNLLKVRKAPSKTFRPPVYTVKSGDTLEAISRRYDISVAEIKRLNSLNDSKIQVGQKLFLQ